MLDELQIALDMGGSSSKCKYFELEYGKESKLQIDDLDLVYELFDPYAKKLAIYSYYKEPDYLANYQELFEKEQKLSSHDIYKRPNIISIYRLNRDKTYIEWLKKIGIKKVKITFSGLESNTDYFTGRTGFYKESLNALNILIENEIIPIIEIIINKKNLNDLKKFLFLIEKLQIKEKVETLNDDFIIYGNIGKPTGENLKNIAYRITEKDLRLIPETLVNETRKYLGIKNPFGIPEHILYEKYIKKDNYFNLKCGKLKLYINHKFDVYFLSTSRYFRLGNLRKNQVFEILENYENNKSFIQDISIKIKIKDLVKEFGNQNGIWLFNEDDYLLYLLELYSEKHFNEK